MKHASALQSLMTIFSFAMMCSIILFVLPITDNFVSTTKLYTFFFFILATVTLYTLRSIKIKAVEIITGPFTLPLVLFGLAAAASTFFTTTYPQENILGAGGVYIGLAAIGVLGPSLIKKNLSEALITCLAITSSILSVLATLQLLGFGPSQALNALFGLSLPSSLVFSLTGSALISLEVIMLSILGVISLSFFRKKISTLHLVLLPILLVGAGVHIWSLLPGKPAEVILPSFSTSWSIALDSLRSPRTAVIGVGSSLYTNAYTQYKPVTVNTSPAWNIPFGFAANTPLTLIVSMGVLGVTTYLLFAGSFLMQLGDSGSSSKALGLLIATVFISQVFLPSNIVLLVILALMIMLYTAAEKDRFRRLQLHPFSVKLLDGDQHATKTTQSSKSTLRRALSLSAGVIPLLLVAWLIYQTGRAYAAHFYMNESAKAAQNDDGVGLYTNQQKAVELNPYLDYMRREYAASNILVAAALSSNKDITQAEQEQVNTLITQAVREARSATILDPSDTQNWTVLAQIYANLIGSIEGADQFAVQSYITAIETDPTNPALRNNLATIFFNAEEYAQAAQLFAQATDLKPDYPQAQYNLAISLANLGDYQNAVIAYQRTLALIDPASAEYAQVQQELGEVQPLAEQQAAAQNQEQAADESTVEQPSLLNEALQNPEDAVSDPATTEEIDAQATPNASDKETDPTQDLETTSSPSPEAPAT
ncbi:MAG: tetratricopeptide repeat protein [Pseudomonadales bacterium]|nr:tetratricopeptide repeat protein [Candidatus Woesebacteria bacterium]MCB9801875.1 tetratricopeptide repeat protein [Pseudomonadales bacterium]